MSAGMLQRRRWTRNPILVATFLSVLLADLVLGLHMVAMAATASGLSTSESAVSIRWSDAERPEGIPGADALTDFTVSVSQTRNLTSQGVRIQWSGLPATNPADFGRNYVQVMQCWSPSGQRPSPQTCQFGAPSSTVAALMGANAPGRGLVEGEDPLQVYGPESLIPPPRNNPNQRAFSIPFVPARGESVFTVTPYYTAATTNEVSAARTGSDGTGVAIMELQTTLEAPHLGCGAPTGPGATTLARDCWLVIIPRGEFNLDGSPFTRDPGERITGSPLSASVWAQRVEVPLAFEPVGVDCPLGRSERRTIGSELVAEAVTSWQAALCQGETTYGYSQIGDEEARRQLVSGASGAAGLAFITKPLSEELAEEATIEYAPVAISAVTVGFNIDYFVGASTPIGTRNGTPVTDLVLNQRLMAKLLTQSYRADVPNGNEVPALASNPRSIRHDPEFLALNPEFQYFSTQAEPEGLLVALGSADANEAVWRWILSDPDARGFLEGEADPWGAAINPFYLALDLSAEPADNFPKADLTTFRQFSSIPEPGYGTLNLRPYMGDFLEAALRARRADAGARTVWDDTRVPPSFVSGGPQPPGRRFALAITDAPSADRYALNTARLVNAAGEAVAPTAGSLQAAIDGMQVDSRTGVLVQDPDRKVRGAYPLTLPTVAAVNLCATDLPGLAEYAALIDFAVSQGQRVGESKGALPAGYLPLPQRLVDQALAASGALRAEVAAPQCAEHQPAPSPSPSPSASPSPSPEPSDDPDNGEDFPIDLGDPLAPGSPSFDPGLLPDAPSSESPLSPESSSPPVTAEVEAVLTGSAGWSASQYGVAGAALLGLPCLVSGPLLLRRGIDP